MLEATSAELLKAFRKKRTWFAILGLGLVVPLAQVLGAAAVGRAVGGAGLDQGVVARGLAQVASPYALARNNLGAVLPGLLLVLCAVFAAFLVGEDRGYRMWKVILTAQPDRLRVLGAKFLAGMAVLGAVVAAVLVGSVLCGLAANAFGIAGGVQGDWGELLSLYALQWLVLAAPLALGFLVSWLVASPALAVIGIVVLPGLAEGLVRAAILAQARGLSPLDAPFQAARVREQLESIPRFFLTTNLNLGSRLLGRDVGSALGSELPGLGLGLTGPSVGWSVTVALLYFALFAGLLVWSFSSRDIHD